MDLDRVLDLGLQKIAALVIMTIRIGFECNRAAVHKGGDIVQIDGRLRRGAHPAPWSWRDPIQIFYF